MIDLGSWMNKILIGWGVDPKIANTFDETIIAILMIFIAVGLDYLCQAIFVGGMKRLARKTSYKWDTLMVKHKVIHHLIHILPGILMYMLLPMAFVHGKTLLLVSQKICVIYMIFALLIADVTRIFVPSLNHGFYYALGATCCLLLYGYYNYRHPQVNKIDVFLDKPIEGHGINIVAVSDVHLGYGTGKAMLKEYVDMINAQHPDLILIGGDLIDNSLTPLYKENMAEELAQLKAPLGIYMVPGNHEYISGIDESVRFLKDTPIQLLRDSVVTLPNGVQIIGRDDRSNRSRHSLPTLLKQADRSKPIILLDHQPYNLAKTDSLGIDLQFSGHTHHGQIWPISWVTDRIYEQSHGYRKWSQSHIYVSSGLSLWGPPFRIGTNSDMAVFRLNQMAK